MSKTNKYFFLAVFVVSIVFYGVYFFSLSKKSKPITEEEDIRNVLQAIEKEIAENEEEYPINETPFVPDEHADLDVLASWKRFEDGLEYEEKENKEDGLIYMFPKFSEDLIRLDGTIIELEGFIFPTENIPYLTNIILSPLPSGQCYFCSNNNLLLAEINLKKSIKFTNDKIKVKGNLVLNRTNPEQAAIVINDAEIIR
jgi:cbb3-type cytochrome oxidase subunit 3